MLTRFLDAVISLAVMQSKIVFIQKLEGALGGYFFGMRNGPSGVRESRFTIVTKQLN
jgi:hypothetical protein